MESEDVSHLRYVPWVQEQAGVLAWLPDTDPVQFAIVTSRRTGRWVFPKGSVDDDMTPQEAAAQEAFEEAGLEGVVAPEPIGAYRCPKIRPPWIWTVEVTLYAMRVDKMLDDWLEIDQRTRNFVDLAAARELLMVSLPHCTPQLQPARGFILLEPV
ncbi:MAG: NUDIX domain-containing protein, partial [Pseudomonadota bacterium]